MVMKRTALILFFSIGVCWSCGKGPGNNEVLVGELTENTSGISVPVLDPDSTDQISGDQYLLDPVSEKTAALVRSRLLQLYGDDLKIGIVDSVSRKFIFFEFDLNKDGNKEIFVGLTGPYLCGSGGCSQFILDAQGEVISSLTVSDYPVVISTES